MVQAKYEVGFPWFSWTCTSCATHVFMSFERKIQDDFDWIFPLLELETSWHVKSLLTPPELNNRAVRFSWKRSAALANNTWREVSDVWAKTLPDLLNRVGGTSHYGDKLSKWRRPLIRERNVWQDAKNSALRTEVCAASAAWLGRRRPLCGSWRAQWALSLLDCYCCWDGGRSTNIWAKYYCIQY